MDVSLGGFVRALFQSWVSTGGVGLLLLSLSGCGFGGGDSGSEPSASDQRIVVANFRAPAAGWGLESDSAYILSLSGCLETLTRYVPARGEIVPMLATEWRQVSPREWDFTLRKGVRFQDGSPMTAEAVVRSLQQVLAAEVPSRAFNRAVVSGVKAVDERTVRVTTPTESPLVPLRMASVNTGVLAPAAFEGEGGVNPFGHCTGPFTPVSEQPQQSLTLDRNEDYWGGQVQLAGAEVRFVTDGAARATQVQTGEADISLSVPVSELSTLEGDPGISVLKSESPRTATLYMNNGRAPFDDIDFRRAVRSALDLDGLAASVYEGAAPPATGPFAPSEPWAPDVERQRRDVEAAKGLLADAGYTADRPLEIIAIVERAELADVATVIQENLKDVGVPVTITIKEYAAVEPDLLAGDYDMVLSQRNRLIDIADPIGFLTADYTCDGAYNLSHFCDEKYDKLIVRAARTGDVEERYRLYGKAGRLLEEQAVNVWLVNEQAIDVVRSDVGSYVQDPLARYVLTADTTKATS
ncbi:MAG TPA: ABC transporter substrate-binding protein [Pseudonocardiaceae bacterium]|nr:ABC transporter substrate-binding protein [Pseudonocardiaceae bacterium]